jgi:hypothetical protein
MIMCSFRDFSLQVREQPCGSTPATRRFKRAGLILGLSPRLLFLRSEPVTALRSFRKGGPLGDAVFSFVGDSTRKCGPDNFSGNPPADNAYQRYIRCFAFSMLIHSHLAHSISHCSEHHDWRQLRFTSQ